MDKSGVGKFQIGIAKAAKWPYWEFVAAQDTLVFVNHSAIGVIREDIPLDMEYKWTDGKKAIWTCKATWSKTEGGGVLMITRKSATGGSYVEERRVSDHSLEFVLKNPQFDGS